MDPKMEVVVEKFQARGIQDNLSSSSDTGKASPDKKWIRISPKKRERPFPTSHQGKQPPVKHKISEPFPPPSIAPSHTPEKKDKGKDKAVLNDSLPKARGSGTRPPHSPVVVCQPLTEPNPLPFVSSTPVQNLSPSRTTPLTVSSSPSSPLQATEVFSSPSLDPLTESQGDDHAMDHDGEDDFFLELDDLDEPMMSTESSKKRKVEEGEEFSSHSSI